VTATETHRAIGAVWRIESSRLIAGLARGVRDVALAEDLAQDALVAALETWPETGIPDNPGAWLMTTAKRRGIDLLRRRTLHQRKHDQLGRELEPPREDLADELDAALDDEVGDDLLRLIFTACHPVLSTDARVALTLRLLGGLATEEIARAFLVPVPTVAQRIVRAERTLSEAGVSFEVPRGEELEARRASARPASRSSWPTRTARAGTICSSAAGLELVDALTGEPSLRAYHLLPAVRGDFLIKLGRHAEARRELERAAAMTGNERERALLLERAAACGSPRDDPS
jgi:RNA polymerase sigma factor (sigma-70 family)